MKKSSFLAGAVLCILLLSSFMAKPVFRKVVYASTVDCVGCKKKVMENISFNRGVKDVSVDLLAQTVTIVFDESKTDTVILGGALRKLGYGAKIVQYE